MNIGTTTVSREQTVHPGNQEMCNQFKLPVLSILEGRSAMPSTTIARSKNTTIIFHHPQHIPHHSTTGKIACGIEGSFIAPVLLAPFCPLLLV